LVICGFTGGAVRAPEGALLPDEDGGQAKGAAAICTLLGTPATTGRRTRVTGLDG